MNDFNFYSPTLFAFGKDKELETGALVRRFGGSRVLVHFGGGSAVRSGLLDRVTRSLEAAGLFAVKLGGVKPNPRSSKVEEGVALCAAEKIDFILAVGGGSVIDSSKAIAIGAANGGHWREYYVGKDRTPPPIPAALPVGVVLTIAAAGSEGSGNSVITLEPENLKRATSNDVLRPRFSVLNPALTFSLPPYQTACGLTDMFAHVCERYFTQTRDVVVTDELCEAVMRTVVAESAKVLADPNDYQARANVMWAGMLAHNNTCGVGRAQDWASHGIEHELSALYDCAHGAGLAVVMPAWMDYVCETDLVRFVRFATHVWGISPQENDLVTARAGIAAFRSWLKGIGMPLTFAELGAREEDIPLLVKTLGLNGNKLGSFRPLDDADVEAIYRRCLG
ncbi:MAG: iron-containing alcohol dehydrogenase [Kiritimatiellae bacterium]|nr:iron-containing alcohol dehydrogenase [Kiritimatiellia bacterium]